MNMMWDETVVRYVQSSYILCYIKHITILTVGIFILMNQFKIKCFGICKQFIFSICHLITKDSQRKLKLKYKVQKNINECLKNMLDNLKIILIEYRNKLIQI